jgi:hypothetical protein
MANMARILFSLAAVAVFLCFDVPSSHALYGEAPWCAVREIGNGEVEWDCTFASAAECAPTVVAGNRGFCNQNPYYRPSPVLVPRHWRRHRPHY